MFHTDALNMLKLFFIIPFLSITHREHTTESTHFVLIGYERQHNQFRQTRSLIRAERRACKCLHDRRLFPQLRSFIFTFISFRDNSAGRVFHLQVVVQDGSTAYKRKLRLAQFTKDLSIFVWFVKVLPNNRGFTPDCFHLHVRVSV